MNITGKIQKIIQDILDIEEDEITPDAYLIRELNAESIDLLELAVSLNSEFGVEIKDDEIFMAKLRLYLNEAGENKNDAARYIAGKYPFLSDDRINEILATIEEGPVLKVKDLADYVAWRVKA